MSLVIYKLIVIVLLLVILRNEKSWNSPLHSVIYSAVPSTALCSSILFITLLSTPSSYVSGFITLILQRAVECVLRTQFRIAGFTAPVLQS